MDSPVPTSTSWFRVKIKVTVLSWAVWIISRWLIGLQAHFYLPANLLHQSRLDRNHLVNGRLMAGWKILKLFSTSHRERTDRNERPRRRLAALQPLRCGEVSRPNKPTEGRFRLRPGTGAPRRLWAPRAAASSCPPRRRRCRWGPLGPETGDTRQGPGTGNQGPRSFRLLLKSSTTQLLSGEARARSARERMGRVHANLKTGHVVATR